MGTAGVSVKACATRADANGSVIAPEEEGAMPRGPISLSSSRASSELWPLGFTDPLLHQLHAISTGPLHLHCWLCMRLPVMVQAQLDKLTLSHCVALHKNPERFLQTYVALMSHDRHNTVAAQVA